MQEVSGLGQQPPVSEEGEGQVSEEQGEVGEKGEGQEEGGEVGEGLGSSVEGGVLGVP